MAKQSSIELNEEREDIDDSKIYNCNENYGLTIEQDDQLVNLICASSSNADHNISTRKVNLIAHTNNHITLGITQITYSFNYSKHASWNVNYGVSEHICPSMIFFDDYMQIVSVNIILPNGHM